MKCKSEAAHTNTMNIHNASVISSVIFFSTENQLHALESTSNNKKFDHFLPLTKTEEKLFTFELCAAKRLNEIQPNQIEQNRRKRVWRTTAE